MRTTGGTPTKDSPAKARKERRGGQPEPLSAEAARWLNELPQTVRPMKTCARFARIVNKLAAAWTRPGDCESLFEELLLDRRGDRQGFPVEIAFELAALKNYFETAVHPSKQTIWDDIIQRGRST